MAAKMAGKGELEWIKSRHCHRCWMGNLGNLKRSHPWGAKFRHLCGSTAERWSNFHGRDGKNSSFKDLLPLSFCTPLECPEIRVFSSWNWLLWKLVKSLKSKDIHDNYWIRWSHKNWRKLYRPDICSWPSRLANVFFPLIILESHGWPSGVVNMSPLNLDEIPNLGKNTHTHSYSLEVEQLAPENRPGPLKERIIIFQGRAVKLQA